MTTEAMPPTAILASSGFTSPDVTDVQDDPSSPDSDWIGGTLPFSVRFGFGTPSSPLSGTQTFRVLLRRADVEPNVTISLYEGGELVRVLAVEMVSSPSGQIVTATFDASEVSVAADVELVLTGALAANADVHAIAGTLEVSGQVVVVATTVNVLVPAVAGSIDATGAVGVASASQDGAEPTFPVVEDRAESQTNTTNTTSHPIQMPDDVQVGELLLVWFGTDGQPTITIGSGTGWATPQQASFGSNIHTAAITHKVATGNDALTLQTSDAQQSSHMTWRLSGNNVDAWSVNWTFSNGSSANSNPPNHTPAGGLRKYLWIAARAGDNTVSPTGYPANYSNGRALPASGVAGSSVAAAERELEATSQDPGAFTVATERWVCATIAVSYTALEPSQQPKSAIATAGAIEVTGNQGIGLPVASAAAHATAGAMEIAGNVGAAVIGTSQTTPAYLGGLTYDTELIQGSAMTAVNVAGLFSGGGLTITVSSDALSDFAIPAGTTLSGGIWSGTPSTFQGRRWVRFKATNSQGTAYSSRILVSVRPRTGTGGAFGTSYTTTRTGAQAAQTWTTSNTIFNGCTFSGRLQLRGCTNILIINCTFDFDTNEDGVRLSNTTAGCDRVVIYNNKISATKDGINISGNWPFHGPDLYVLNNWLHDCGNNADPQEHGMYIHTRCVIEGNVVYNSNFGNAISTRSSAVLRCNFTDGCRRAGCSYFPDHPESGTYPWDCFGNVTVNTSTGASDGAISLRDDNASNLVSEFNIGGNWYDTTNAGDDFAGIEIGTIYGGLVDATASTLLSTSAARAMFPYPAATGPGT